MQNPQNKPKVPNDLCEQILNYQLEIQSGNLTQDLVSKVIELYMEAMNIYTSHPSYAQAMAQTQGRSREERNSFSFIPRGHEFYQDKIKKLLLRKDVQKCLVGTYRPNQKAIDLQHEIEKIERSAPEQAKALLQYFKRFHNEQQKLIKKTVQQQNTRLQERIQRRSRSKSNRQNSALKENNSFLSNLNLPNCGSKNQKGLVYKNIGVNLGI